MKPIPVAFDAVNIYGDEFQSANDFSDVLTALAWESFTGKATKNGPGGLRFRQPEAGRCFALRLKPSESINSPTLILSSNFSTGTTVYQGDNRFSLRDIKFYQHRLELNKYDKYFFLAFMPPTKMRVIPSTLLWLCCSSPTPKQLRIGGRTTPVLLEYQCSSDYTWFGRLP